MNFATTTKARRRKKTAATATWGHGKCMETEMRNRDEGTALCPKFSKIEFRLHAIPMLMKYIYNNILESKISAKENRAMVCSLRLVSELVHWLCFVFVFT